MLHEILLSLSGHPSPLLQADHAGSHGDAAISPPERELLASVAHLSDLHVQLLGSTAQISSSHPSTICRAVASAVDTIHLRAFQQKVLDVEESILRKDAGFVGAYNIVPLTAVVGEFSDWTRRMEWLGDIVQFMLKPERTKDEKRSVSCTSARIIDRLRSELQTGYMDIEETARSLVRAAEVAWLKHVSSWILYGRLPSFGQADFFVQRSKDGDDVINTSWNCPFLAHRPTNRPIGICLCARPLAVVRYDFDSYVHAVHWEIAHSYSSEEQCGRQLARDRSPFFTAQGTVQVDIPAR